ncbi:MAG TPA: hypothetical protein VIK14_06695, partial [Ignavibacteria bacterium]
MRKIYLYILFIFLITCFNNTGKAQLIYYMVPDTGSQGTTFPVTILGSETYWTASTYVEIYFDSTGVYGTNVAIINDTTLTASVDIWGNSYVGYHKLIVSDQFLNFITKDSAFFVKLSAPIAPVLVLPPDNYQLANTNPLFTWDTNGYAATFRIQVSTDSLFNNLIKDTTKQNMQGYQIPDILQLNTYYWWRVKFFNTLGESPWSVVFKFKTKITGINLISSNTPQFYKLYENYPNPFNPVTKIKFDIPSYGFPLGAYGNDKVVLKVYDLLGKEIATLVNDYLNAGSYEISWNANYLSSGIYF